MYEHSYCYIAARFALGTTHASTVNMARTKQPKQPTKRERVLNSIRFQAYHDSSGLKAYLDNGVGVVSYESYKTARSQGIAAKQRGIPCNCYECKANTTP